MKSLVIAATVCLVLSACQMDSAQRKYATFQAYATDGAIADDMMAAPILPKSATDIAVDLDLDQDEAVVDFAFAPTELGMVVSGFMAISPGEHARLVKEPWMKLPDKDAIVMRRCSADRVEFLALSTNYHVHFQSTQFPAMLAKFCPK